MPPRTRSNKMAGTSAEGEETSMTHPTPDGDLVSMMARMMKEFKQEMMIQMDVRAKESIARSKESEARMLAAQNTLFEEFNTLKGGRTSRTPTSRGNHLPNVAPEEMMEEVVYEGWQRGNDRNRVNHMENDRFGGRNGAHGHFKGDYESRYHGDGLDRGYSGKRAPKSHGEWHSKRVRDHVSHNGFERPIEEEVSYRARLRPTYPHGGVDTNQRGNLIEGMEVRHHVVHGLETTHPEKEQEERGQVDELLAQGSSALSLSPCDVSLNEIILEKPLCVDKFVIDVLCKKWSHELETLNAKSTFAPYIDPFLVKSSIERHDISLVASTLNVGVTSLHAKMPKLSFVGNFELHVYVDEDTKTKKSNMDNDFRTWCLLCLHCKVVKPFNGIGVFYGRFVKDFSTHMSLEDDVVTNGIKLHRSHVCGIVLKLLEQLCGANLETFLMILDVVFYKYHMHGVESCLHVVHEGLWTHCSLMFDNLLKLMGQWDEIHIDELCLLNDNLSCKLNVNYHKPPLYPDLEFVNLWKRTSYLSKNGVLMIENDCSLHERENKIFVLRPLLITFHFAPYEDPFLYMPCLDENAKSFVKMLKDMGIDNVEMFEAKRVKLCEACVWHNTCFHCMTIKPFSGRLVPGVALQGLGILTLVRMFGANGVKKKCKKKKKKKGKGVKNAKHHITFQVMQYIL
ncbi:uncharacterized protein LOC125194744 [Salvia hispanica]|uniref:uncharacterized protein LOC125194744 n=1 Tax=Salvia hispanica TaxID=49212 RepID=UPI0020092268|nr:uncharacterized protein LOC125194744 [Salvia hispanica]